MLGGGTPAPQRLPTAGAQPALSLVSTAILPHHTSCFRAEVETCGPPGAPEQHLIPGGGFTVYEVLPFTFH